MFLIQITIFLFSIFSSFMIEDLYLNGIIVFWSYLAVLVLEIFQKKRITLLFVFLIAFIYMIPGEAILQTNELYSMWGKEYTNIGFNYLVVSSFAVFFGFKIADLFFSEKWKFEIKPYKTIVSKKKTLLFFILAYNILFLLVNLENTIIGLTMGRNNAFPYFYSSLLYALAYLTVGLTDRLTQNKLNTILLSLPIIITLLGTGTRFLIVFLVFILFFDYLYEMTFKKSIRVMLLGVMLIIGMNTMKDIRTVGLLSGYKSSIVTTKHNNITEKLVSYGSSEGLIRNAAMITRYTKDHHYTYGKSIGFLAIFWIPRELWPDKPVMLDSWLVKEYYSGYGEGYSSASSYGGELYMDFGFFIACLILFVGGWGLCRLNYWIHNNYKTDLKKYIISGFLYGWIFFGTRSIMTSSYMLIYVILSSYIVFKLLVRYKIINRKLVLNLRQHNKLKSINEQVFSKFFNNQ